METNVVVSRADRVVYHGFRAKPFVIVMGTRVIDVAAAWSRFENWFRIRVLQSKLPPVEEWE